MYARVVTSSLKAGSAAIAEWPQHRRL